MMKYTCIAVDDEPLALAKISGFIKRMPMLDLKNAFSTGLEAMDYINNHTIDMVFLDIQMDDLTGIQLLEILHKQPKIVLTTAYDEYALKSYDLNVCDYLLKPISFNRFVKAVNKAIEELNTELGIVTKTEATPQISTNDIEEAKNSAFVFIKTEYKIQKVMFSDIFYIKGMKDYLQVVTQKETILTLQSFSQIEKLLPSKLFVRTHKSYIISMDKIESIERNRIRIKEEIIPVSNTYKKDFYKRLEGHKLE